MKQVCILALLLTILTACQTTPKSKGYTLHGTITGEVPKVLILEYNNLIDTVIPIEGKFELSGTLPGITETYLRVPGISAFANDHIYLENTEMQLYLSIEKRAMGEVDLYWVSADSLKGTETARLRADYERFESGLGQQKNNKEAILGKLEEIAMTYPDNPYSARLIESKSEHFSRDELKELFHHLDTTTLAPGVLENLRKKIDPARTLMAGNAIADFILTDPDGKLINTLEFRNKTVYLDFWASWCGPCRKKFPDLKDIHERYQPYGFEILGVSIDTDTLKWKNALKKDQLPWPNLIEPHGFDGPVAARYGLSALPTTFLVGPEGKIIANDIPLKELETYLETTLK